MKILIDGVKSDEEIGEDVLLRGGDVSEEGRNDDLSGRERLSDGND